MPSTNPGCLFSILKLFGLGSSPGGEEPLPYRLRDDFLSPAEISFFRVLEQVVGDQAVICPKVRVADILFVTDRKTNVGHANRINQKHVDFLLCDPTTMRPIGAVELDDASHGRADREARDNFIDAAFQAAGLRVIHVKAKRGYALDEVATLIAPLLSGKPSVEQPTQPVPAVSSSTAPSCPKCGVEMVLRTAKQGSNRGGQFWGCQNYPRCREVIALAVAG